jgi:hypothetical protein
VRLPWFLRDRRLLVDIGHVRAPATTAGQAAETLGVPSLQAPRAVTFMLAAECLPFRGVITRRRPVAHFRQFSCREHLELPHG